MAKPSYGALASLAGLASLALAPLLDIACGSSNASPTGDAGAGAEAGEVAEAGGDANDFQLIDSSIGQRCTMANLADPVGLCAQKQVLLSEHALFSPDAGMPSAWSVDTDTPVAGDGGAVLHDYRDDLAYGSSLAAYYVSATAYEDPDGLSVISADMLAAARLVESELATPPQDYDGVPYLRLRRLAAGLRVAGFPTDATAVDAIADKYGRAIYTTYFHTFVAPSIVGADTSADDGGGVDASSVDAGSVEDAASVDAATSVDAAASVDAGTSIDAATGIDAAASADAATSVDAGPPDDGILGTPSGSGFAYDTAKAAAGALALVDMAARANGLAIPFPDAGLDGAVASDPSDATAWSNAAAVVFAHINGRARDTSGFYFGALVTSADPGHDAVTDDGAFAAHTQASVALAYLRAARLASLANLSAPSASSLTSRAGVILDAAQNSTPALWDPTFGDLSLSACPSNGGPAPPCGSGFFAGLDPTKTVLDERKGVSDNALFLSALHRANLLGALSGTEGNDLAPLLALFSYVASGPNPGTNDGFFTQVPYQQGYVDYVTATFALTETEDGGLPTGGEDGGTLPGAGVAPLARAYSTQASADALEGMNDQWVGVIGAPTFFQ